MALAVAVAVLALSVFYSSVSVLGRVYPALFPGQTLASSFGMVKVVAPLPGLNSVDELNDASAFNDRINLLILGLDQRPQDVTATGHLTDMIIVASLDPLGKQVNFLSFPRDLYVDIHQSDDDPYDYYKDRLNTSFMVGFDLEGSAEDGARQVQRDLLANFGVETDHWVILDFKGVERLIDAVGGVDLEIEPELAVPNWWYSDDDRNAHWIAFPEGEYHLDGYDAVAFGRYRNDSDLLRVKRQQVVAEAGVSKLFNLGLLNDPIALCYD